jgi:deazaflavin-dependent oxidoreductase (nitroreductase family)
MQVPRSVARFNRTVNNPIQRQFAWLMPPWVIIVHRGRKSGRVYRTPVNGYKRDRVFAAVILYGEDSDWVQNVLAGGAQLVRGGRTYTIADPRVVDPRGGDSMPALARTLGRVSGKVLVARVEGPERGFGRGPKAHRRSRD